MTPRYKRKDTPFLRYPFPLFDQHPQTSLFPMEASIRRRRLYLATRSVRQGAPDLMRGAPVATAMSAMVVSSVSPERWERMKE